MTGPTPPTPTTSVPPGLPAFDFQPLGRQMLAAVEAVAGVEMS